ncbi:hypothetical protein RchiOBHm_Chr2g0156241 [Rosa chinensis]|uniref:Uncharacterized protein n=1 Tax=Rosa chinensis TaxID=74649 RepID=A0A2P6S1E7_ROSCH|nr:hypothetical protein RchiOBHm_Chr2g0156241 [Rosa chinensis]
MPLKTTLSSLPPALIFTLLLIFLMRLSWTMKSNRALPLLPKASAGHKDEVSLYASDSCPGLKHPFCITASSSSWEVPARLILKYRKKKNYLVLSCKLMYKSFISFVTFMRKINMQHSLFNMLNSILYSHYPPKKKKKNPACIFCMPDFFLFINELLRWQNCRRKALVVVGGVAMDICYGIF